MSQHVSNGTSKLGYIVKKFGGTSVGSIERIERVAERIQKAIDLGQKPIVTVSAMSGETNRLVELAKSIDPTYRGRAYDMLLASGEQVSISLLAIALEKRHIEARPLLAHQIGIFTDSIFSKARIKKVNGQALVELGEKGIVPIVAGFQGIDDDDQITTLGRGGSDTTAVALAAALRIEGIECGCEIYTDVPAIFTADPRLVPKAREIARLSFEEMMEMASLGSKVLQVRSVELAAKYLVPIHLRSSLEEREGTWVIKEESDMMEQAVVSAVTHDRDTVVFKLFPVPYGPGFLAKLFGDLAENEVVVDIITQSQNEEGQRLAFSVSQEDRVFTEKYFAEKLEKNIKVEQVNNVAKVSVVGVGMRNHPGVAARFFRVLDEQNIPVHLVTTSEIKISAVIDNVHLEKAAQGIHHEFDLDG